MDKQLTSVFSDYDSLDNNSINSRQLEFWLNQNTHQINNQNLGVQWTFMSNASSVFEPEQPSFGFKTSSLKKQKEENIQNNSYMANSPFLHQNQSDFNFRSAQHKNKQKNQKSKSYINAVLALQKRIKDLEEENKNLNNNLSKISKEHLRSVSESQVKEEELKYKIHRLEPNQSKISALIEQKKLLREQKQEKIRKLKLAQKKAQEYHSRYNQLLVVHQSAIQKQQQFQKQSKDLQKQVQALQKQCKRLVQKNKQLEEMKEHSTTALLQKYNKSVEFNEELEKENKKVRKQLENLRKNYSAEESKMTEKYRREIEKYEEEMLKMQGLRSSLEMKESLVDEKKKESEYFKELYKKKDEQFYEYIGKQNQVHDKYRNELETLRTQLLKQKEKTAKLQRKLAKKQTKQNSPIQHIQTKEELSQNQVNDRKTKPMKGKSKNHVIRSNQGKQDIRSCNNFYHSIEGQEEEVNIPDTVIYANCPHEEQSFRGFQSDNDDVGSQEQLQQQFNESYIPHLQTKSLQKPKSISNHKKRKQRTSQQQALSSSSKKQKSMENSYRIMNKLPIQIPKSNMRTGINSREKSQRKAKNKSTSIKPRDVEYLLPEPNTQPQKRITFEAVESDIKQPFANSHLYTASIPHWPQQEQIHQFQQIPYSSSKQPQNYTSLLLIQLQKQLLQLYEQQQRLLIASNQQFLNQSERSQFFGRLKQINQQLRIKNQRVCDIKAQL